MKKLLLPSITSGLLALGLTFVGSAAWAEDEPLPEPDLAIGSVLVGGVSVTSLEVGKEFTARITHQTVSPATQTDDFCGLAGGGESSDNSLAAIFTPASEEASFYIPGGFEQGDAGVGSFTWINNSGSSGDFIDVVMQLPADAVPGEYEVFYGCVDSAKGQPGLGVSPFPVTIVAASNDDPVTPPDTTTEDPTLAHTGVDEASNYALAGASALLMAVGVATYGLRRRVGAKK